ncbi:hypothetical protein JTE90_015432, partial [Oedothorax gibbosus]
EFRLPWPSSDCLEQPKHLSWGLRASRIGRLNRAFGSSHSASFCLPKVAHGALSSCSSGLQSCKADFSPL